MENYNQDQIEEQTVFKIYDVNVELLETKLAKLNKKAIKLNCEPFILNILSTEVIHNKEDQTVNKVYEVELIGTAPKLNNWLFIGTIEQHEKGNIIKAIKDQIYPEHYRNWSNTCEHCHSNRKRKNLYLVKNTITEEYKAVGKTCLKDFLGHNNPNEYARILEICLDSSWLDEFSGIPEGSGIKRQYDLYEYLEYVSACIRESGWISRTKTQEEYLGATADYALEAMTKPMRYRRKDHPEPNKQDKELVQKAIQWAKTLETTNDYLHNINIIANEEITSIKNIGFAASIIPFCTKHIEKEIEKEKRETAKKQELISDYVGEIGQKIQTELTYINHFNYDTQWGLTSIYKFMDNNGNIFIWKTSNNFIKVEQGNIYKIKGRIKDHSEYNGVKQTILTRCKLA